LYWLADLDQAEANLKKAIELRKNFIFARWDLFHLYIIQKEYHLAKKILSELKTITPGDLSPLKALMLASKGHKQKALKILKEPNIWNLHSYCLLDMKDEVLSVITVFLQNRTTTHYLNLITVFLQNRTTTHYLNLLNNPFFKILQNDPRFKKLLEDERIKYDNLLKKFGDL
jgi:hypothetical protein